MPLSKFATFTCKRSLSQNAELRPRLRSWLWKSLAIYLLFSARSRLDSNRFSTEFPAVSAGAGTWVCGNRKTNQMVPGVGSGCKWKQERIRLLGGWGFQMKYRRPYSDGSKGRALKLDVTFLGQTAMRRLRI